MKTETGRERMADGRLARVHIADAVLICDDCVKAIKPGGRFTRTTVRVRSGRQARVRCAECDPVAENWEAESSHGLAARFHDRLAVCGYCGRGKMTVRARVRLDPLTLREEHRMPLCAECADGSGYGPAVGHGYYSVGQVSA